MSRRHYLWAILLLCASAAVYGQAPSDSAGLSWSSLSSEQQRVLGGVQGQWSSLPPERQQALAHGADRWLSMSPEERDGARQRFQTWQQLPSEQKAVIRQRWQRFQQLPPEQQQAVRQNFRAYSRLPSGQRAQLRDRWLNATPQQRQQMLERQRAIQQQRPRAPPGAPGPRGWRAAPWRTR